MRILSISGENIASLAEPFRIDLESEPLRSAGIFLVAGPTGAGKSSILDAMCLALYGDCPRLDAGSSGDVLPDAAGDSLRARDPRAVLRRGAATGWAEVRFQARDGRLYRARWMVRRARDRAEGRLQAVSRALLRDADGKLLESQSTAVNQQVAALTGLSYDEFRRSVLLAQGDFDAFLRAETNDRAALLEKISGSGLYRAVSMRIYDRAEAARAACATLEAARDAQQLLDEAGRQALRDEAQALEQTLAEARARRAVLEAALARHDARRQARERLAQARAALDTARAAQARAAPDRARLALLERVAPLAPVYQAAQDARAALDQAREAEQAARIAADEAASARTATVAEAVAAGLDQARVEADFRLLGALWDRAADLDSQIATAAGEEASARAAADRADAALVRAAGALRTARARSAYLAARQDRARAVAARLEPLAALVALGPRIDGMLAERAAAGGALAEALAEAGRQKAAGEAAEAELQALAREMTQGRADRVTLEARVAGFEADVARFEAVAPQPRAEALAELANALERLAQLAGAHDKAALDQAAAAEALTAARAQGDAARAALAAADADRMRAEAVRDSLAAPADAAQAALSDSARAMRLRLKPGVPCPVCGATDHALPEDAALARLARDLSRDLAAAEAALGAATTAREAALVAASAAEARRQNALAAGEAARAQAEAAQHEWQAALARLGPAVPGGGLAALLPGAAAPPVRVQGAQPAIAALAAQLARAREEVRGMLAHLRQAHRDAEQARRERDRLLARIEAQAAREAALARAGARARQDAALARAKADEAARRLAAVDAALIGPAAAAGVDAALLDAAPGIAAQRLRRALGRQARCTAACARLASAAAGAVVDLDRAEAAHDSAAAAQVDAAHAHTERAARLAALRQARAGLLGGQGTAAHRSAFNVRRLSAAARVRDADARAARAEARLSAARTARDATRQALASARARADSCGRDLARGCAEAGLLPQALAGHLSVPAAARESLRDRIRACDDAVTACAAAADQRQADHEAACAATEADAPEAALSEARAALEAEQAQGQARRGEIAAILRADAAAQRAREDLKRQLSRARADRQIWAAVNDAVGSRNGDRFARQAQALTLDVLVARANRHLADLKPRYRLRRGGGALALQIEDRDLAGALRATRSLSGGERFLVSLALALALAQMGRTGAGVAGHAGAAGRDDPADGAGGEGCDTGAPPPGRPLTGTLFIDEGFGALDGESLELAMDALEALRAQGRNVGIISHVETVRDRVPVQVAVIPMGSGRSRVRVSAPDLAEGPAGTAPTAGASF